MRAGIPLISSILTLLALGACATAEADVDGPFYPSGFLDGCRTAQARQRSFSTEQYRDLALFKAEASYRTGWRAGYNQCTNQYNNGGRPGDLGEQDTL